ncbi:MAG: VWA domain-containing protein [Anaerolineae bacterium]
MDQVLTEFVQTLRRAGLRVSSSETLDGLLAAGITGIDDRDRLRAVLRAAMVKRSRDIPTFDDIFDRFFGLGDGPLSLGRPMLGQGQPGEGPFTMDQSDLERAIQMALRQAPRQAREGPQDDAQQALDELGRQISELTEALLRGDMPQVMARLAAALQERRGEASGLEPSDVDRLTFPLASPLQRGRMTQEILSRLDWSRVVSEMQALIRALAAMGEDELAQLLRGRARDVQELFPRWVAEEVASGFDRRNPEWRPPIGRALAQKDFSEFTEAEIEAMSRQVDLLARKLRDDLSRRRQSGGRKRLDVSRTLRRSMRTAGVPMELMFREPRPSRLRLAVLCDVSSSVRNASRFMLQLVYSLQQQRGRIRSFVFISDLTEVSDFFERNPLDAAVQMALSEADIPYWAHSNFGRAFRIFLDEYGDAINTRTTVIVLGDGRSNFHDPQLDALATIRQRARRLIWLNPESRWGWGYGDSIIDLYAQECDFLTECRNLEQLTVMMEYLAETAR